MEVTLRLTVEEVNTVLHTLAQLPTSSGVWPLLVKIKQDAEAQLNQQPQALPGAFEVAEE